MQEISRKFTFTTPSLCFDSLSFEELEKIFPVVSNDVNSNKINQDIGVEKPL